MEVNLNEINQRIKEVKNRIKINEEAKQFIVDNYIKSHGPSGYKAGTSYLDADTIHGSTNRNDLFEFADRLQKLEHLIYLDNIILENYLEKKNNLKLLEELKDNEYKIFYMNKILGMTLEEVSYELHLDYGYVRKINMRLMNRIREEKK